MIVYECSVCGALLETGTASEEKAGQFAAKVRWVVGLPRNGVWCDRCANTFADLRARAMREAYQQFGRKTGSSG